MGRLNGCLLRSSWRATRCSLMSLRVTVSTGSFAGVGPPTPDFALTFQGEGEVRPTAALASKIHLTSEADAERARDGI